MGDSLEGEAQGTGVRPRVSVKRWHVIAGICLINGYRKGAELGVAGGRFSSYLCGIMPEMRIDAVDLWAPQPQREIDGAETYQDWPHESIFENLVKANQDLFQNRINLLRMTTQQASILIEDASLDFVFIDADHTEEGCKADILAWTPKVRSGGLLCGHDYDWPSVKRAVLATGGKAIKESDNVWLRFKP